MALLALSALAGAFGCENPSPSAAQVRSPVRLAPGLERMRQTYEDLASGRFVSIADFETPGQEEMFRCVGAEGSEAGRAQPALSILRSRNETGAGGLKVRLGEARDQVRFDGQRSAKFALLRDWRPYNLLLMSVYGPPGGAVVEFGVESGLQTTVRWSKTISVGPGWNLFRIDVPTVGDWVDLADIRALTWRGPQITGPLELYLDDLILADNTQAVLGQPNTVGDLHVFTRGRRVCVGVGERFELELCDALIVRWQSGGDANLAAADGLGPWPVPLADDWFTRGAPVAYDDPALYKDWGGQVVATQRLVEATPFRVVLEGRWRFVAAAPTATGAEANVEHAPGHTWRYAIYPGGQVYVQVRSTAPPVGWGAPRIGYGLAVDGRRGFQRIEAGAERAAEVAGFVLLARPGPKQADLLWTWPSAAGLSRQRAQTSEDERRLAVIVGDTAAAGTVETAHLLRFWPTDVDTAVEARSLAEDYRQPARVVPRTGMMLGDQPGDLDRDGFNEVEGCYELALDAGVLRFELDPDRLIRYDPVFRVHETAGRRAWVYARGRLIETLGRDAQDNLLFHLERTSGARLPVEVHAPADSSGN